MVTEPPSTWMETILRYFKTWGGFSWVLHIELPDGVS
jgi:hypothetical protein